jgi:hypothetical protein
MEDEAIPVMNSINAPLELCEQVRERFLHFLNSFIYADGQEDGQPSQSVAASQNSGECAAATTARKEAC